MAKYKISREFFPFSHFTPPISEKFLAMAVRHMKTPKYIFKDKELDVSRHKIKSYAAMCWAYDNADLLGIDTARIGIGGDSAGSTLAVGVCMMARDRKHPVRFAFQMLPYPFLDMRNNSESCKKFTDTPMWNSALSSRIAPMTKVDRNDPSYVYYSPVEAESFEGLPPAYIETAEFDCLHDDGILYAKKLREAGIEVTLNETKGTMHGFDIVQNVETTRAAVKARIEFMQEYFGSEGV